MTKKEMENSGKQIAGTLEILTATIVWGYGYIVIRNSFSMISLNILMTWRYVIAFAVLLAVFRRRMALISRRMLAEGAVLGLLLYASQYFQTSALSFADTTAGKVAFITALYVVLVPFLNWAVFRKKPGRLCILSICLAVPGLFLLTWGGAAGIGKGDLLALIGSIGFSVHILAIDSFTNRDDTIVLTIIQFGFAAVYAGIVQLISGDRLAGEIWNMEILWPLFYLGVFSTMLGFLMQFLGQERLPADISALLLATESVFGMLFSFILLGERPSAGGWAGCALMLAAVILAEQHGEEKANAK